ncbi:MAG: tRNA (cytidine(34)-2'-O)-methyltransferase [Verrucomicrobia subdivision 3 bacterium]|nr:tRNA (cytidine(34)-2'-O)-methyltransferase [Limisphaerales bacterium]MCS1414239.1 tRNA (cytidine(34)-2'-O)-methyltransferase [Limisphaerales bacterium]
MHIVLLEPEIPPNTGNIARLCAATKTTLHLIEPLGFKLNDKRLQRAGMDYWQHVSWHQWANWSAFHNAHPTNGRFWLIESAGTKHHAEANYRPSDYLVFGRESAGLPQKLLAQYPDAWLRIPMFTPDSRSLNLANCAAIVLYEALRQQGFPGETRNRRSLHDSRPQEI